MGYFFNRPLFWWNVGKLILLRHGQSQWNAKNVFTGWIDVPLSEVGIQEALAAGEAIKNQPIDIIYTSTLIRAQMTATLAMLKHAGGKVPVFMHAAGGGYALCDKEIFASCVPIYVAEALNERMYGELQGLNKAKMAERYGEAQVQLWRRSYATSPPGGESLEQTAKRTLPYFKSVILPELAKGKSVFVAAHGNSLRSIIMDIEQLSSEQVVKLELETGQPRLYDYKAGMLVRVG